ncbi:MAG: M20/M25/M40 family metallo-hydrolase [Oscillospiraceae bacterium]
MTERLEKVLAYIDEHSDEYLNLLLDLLHQPSIAASGEGIREMIELVQEKMRGVGVTPELVPTKGNPVIYAELKGESPRIYGCYDHYDVQPVDPIELWDSDPFAAEIREGVIYARGVADNKDGLATRLCVIDAWMKTYGKLPCGMKLIFEGEEEIGSPNLEYFAENNPEKLLCDGYVWEGGEKEEGGPCEITMGVKGLLYVHLKVKTSPRDAHSMYAAISPNPAWRLVLALASIKDAEGNILIDGFYDDIIPPTAEELATLADDPFDMEGTREYLGIEHYIGKEEKQELLEKLYFKPTFNICGIKSGFLGEGSKTVLPGEASAKADIRLVPGMDPKKIFDLIRAHLDKNGFTDVELIWDSGEPAFRSDLNAPFTKAVVNACTKLYNRPVALKLTSGGTSPMHAFCQKENIPAGMFGASSAAANIHAPNEHLSVKAFIEMIKINAAVMDELSAY